MIDLAVKCVYDESILDEYGSLVGYAQRSITVQQNRPTFQTIIDNLQTIIDNLVEALEGVESQGRSPLDRHKKSGLEVPGSAPQLEYESAQSESERAQSV